VFLQLWYFNSANVHQSYLGIDLLTRQDTAVNVSMVGEFDLYGTNQYIRLWIDCYPMSNETQWTGLTIQVKGTFSDVNGSREYSDVYNKTIAVESESIQGINRIEYFFNFSNEIQKVKEQVYPEQSLDNIGIYGSLALDVTIHGIVGQVGTQNYIKLALHADSESPYGWVLLPSIRIPDTAQWQLAKIDGVDMTETFPDLQQTTLTVTQGIGNDHQIYAVWQTSASTSWLDLMTKFPISLGWGLLIGIIAGLSSRIIYDKRQGISDRLHGRKRSVTENDTTHKEPNPQQMESDEKEKDRELELQIELTKLQIQHEEAHSYNTVLLSIVASTLLATASVFGTLLATTDDLSYGYLSLIFDVPLFLFTIVIVRSTRKVHKDLDYDIKKLKDRFLSKQAEEKKETSKP